jgi:hypothetical protein
MVHMVHLAIHEILLPMWLVPIFVSRNCLSHRALPHKVTSQPILETGSAITASLSWCILRLEWLGEDLVVRSGETVAAHWLDEPGAKASASGSLGVATETEGAALALASAAGSSVVA